jgi:predicted amidohydrolase YtcJ
LIYPPDRLLEMVRRGHEMGYAIAIHSIGDRSTDLVMEAYEALDDPSRHRIEHVMMLSDLQIERMAKLGCAVTMQPEFLKQFAHSYKRQLPEELFSKLERFRNVHRAGIPLALNSDRPIVPGDPWDGILTAANRPEGFDPAENLDRIDGIRAYTELASQVNGDGRAMGTLEPGSQAAFGTYREDPVTSPRPEILARCE